MMIIVMMIKVIVIKVMMIKVMMIKAMMMMTMMTRTDTWWQGWSLRTTITAKIEGEVFNRRI